MSISIPEGITVTADAGKVSVKGPKGSLSDSFKDVSLKIEGKDVVATTKDPVMVGTVEAHLRNMFIGVTQGYTVNMKIIYSHFPLTLEIKGKEILIKNFGGEKIPRKCKIVGETKVQVAAQNVTVTGISKYDVGQTVANLRQATRTKKKDSRVFQDGVYISEE
ncbi:50S ribosomal protein L6 [Candidatus Gugararchaeum adminiculabundum]|nr:50S ribosomal protein L6 [Candidatus Gugararchaeum adminiculabundum]